MATNGSLAKWQEIVLKEAFQPEIVSLNKVYSFVETTSAKDKQAVVVFGANWCPDCQILAGLIKIAQENQLIQKSFEFLLVDVQDYEINMDSLRQIDASALTGIPRVFIFDSSDNLINKQENEFFRTLRSMGENALVDYLISFKHS